jgi:hypothetical protein
MTGEQGPVPGSEKRGYIVENWAQIYTASEEALLSDAVERVKDSPSVLASRWQKPNMGYRFYLERDATKPRDENTIYTLRVESFLERGRSIIKPEQKNDERSALMPYGVFRYSYAQGIIGTPEGSISSRLLLFERNDPMATYEDAIQEFLGYAKDGWKEYS